MSWQSPGGIASGEEADETAAAAKLEAEVKLDDEIQSQLNKLGPFSSTDAQYAQSLRGVFLTGATGFLGAFLLTKVLEKTSSHTRVYCAVRASSLKAGQSRLRSNLEAHMLWKDFYQDRIVAVIADLSKVPLQRSASVCGVGICLIASCCCSRCWA